MLKLQIEDQKSDETFKYSILKSLSHLMRKELGFINIFNDNPEYIMLIQKQLKENSTDYLLLNELLDIISCMTSQDDKEDLIYEFVFGFSTSSCYNPEQKDQNKNSSFFLFDTMFSCLNEKVDIKIDEKIYMILQNILLSGQKCLQKCKEYKVAHKLIKIIQNEQNEQSYQACLDVIRSYIILLDEDQDYLEIQDLSNTTGILQNYFNQTVQFQDQTKLQQLCLLLLFLYAGDKLTKQYPNQYNENPVIQSLQKYHQLEFLNQFQYEQNTQIYQITSQIIQQYIDTI